MRLDAPAPSSKPACGEPFGDRMSQRAAVCVAGAWGRMGTRVARLLESHPRLRFAVALEVAGKQAQEHVVPSTSDATKAVAMAQVVIDFSAPAAAASLAPVCASGRVPYLVASTALTAQDLAAIDAAAAHTPVLQAANLSLGVNVLLELAELAARRLSGFDVEIFEIHHRHKRDAPSGTALALGEAVQRGRGTLTPVLARGGQSHEREAHELGYAALRGGEVAGEHTVYFFGEVERIELGHRASSPDVFAQGALVAAEWLLDKPAGRYTMRDVLAARP